MSSVRVPNYLSAQVSYCPKCPSALMSKCPPSATGMPKYPSALRVSRMSECSMVAFERPLRVQMSDKEVLCIWKSTKIVEKVLRNLILKQNQSIDLKSFWYCHISFWYCHISFWYCHISFLYCHISFWYWPYKFLTLAI